MRLVRELDPVEIRVLGALMEKQQATPDGYPLTLNTLLLACNQKTNREPVMDLPVGDVSLALDRLQELVLVWKVGGARAERWEHNLDARWDLDGPSKALLTVLTLRGEQTPGELRARCDRLHPFTSVEEIEGVLTRMAAESEPLVFELPRRPGQKESRWSLLLGGSPPGTERAPAITTAGSEESLPKRVARLEEAVAELSRGLEALRKRLGDE
jgi:hypothetical protein